MADDYDFQINNLKFRAAVHDQLPYTRGTAPFRKEQFDSAPTVGDQSLSGWWTRGQLSFHKGAGVKYYELLSGDSVVLDRFQDSSGIDPWEPGEVTLSASLAPIALASVEDAVSATYAGTPGVMAKVGTSLRFVSNTVGATVQSWQPTRPILSVTSSGDTVYFCTAQSIEKPTAATITFTNHWTNPRFYASGTVVTGYNGGAGPAPTFTYNNGYLSFTADATDPSGYSVALTGLTVGTEYRVLLNHQAAAGNVTVRLDDGATGTVVASGSADPLEGTFAATATSHTVFVVAATLGGTYQIREFSVTDDLYSSTVNPIDDPDKWSWSGTAHQSKATRTLPAGTSFYDMWYPPAGKTWAKVWWAKARLFALDSSGTWHTLGTTGGTASSATDFWAPNLGTTGWSVAESPGAVYIAKGTDIYLVVPNSDGSVPTITTPVVAASLPSGESISTIFCYLSRLIICTNLGMRVALVNSDGTLAYGATTIEGDFSDTARITALRDLAYVVGIRDGDATPSLFAASMIDGESVVEPAWAQVQAVTTGSLYGAVVTPDGKIMTWDGAGFFRSTTGYETTGWLLTGFHRLGTLEPKGFQYVRVKTEGTTGSVQVDAVLPDGTTTNIGTVSAGASADLNMRSAVPTPQEYVGLKFTLTGDGTSSPTLLGYQMKALPVPQRQRILKWPLKITDTLALRNGTQTGRTGRAYEAITELEDLESSAAVVTFTDHRTGETGSAYIDEVEFQGSTPSGYSTNGFGGVAYLTLRVLS